MNTLQTPVTAFDLTVGHVIDVESDGSVSVRIEAAEVTLLRCGVLNSGLPARLVVGVGDGVLVCQSRFGSTHVVIGVITPAPEVGGEAIDESDTVADELVIQAKQSLTLRVGDGSITIREDGRILIKGKDLVSHATRRNRIKGASVEIN